MYKRKILYIFLIILLISLKGFSNVVVLAQTSENPELDDAKLKLASALKAIQSADSNGVDVQTYINVLNTAKIMLYEAQILGNASQSMVITKSVSAISKQVETSVLTQTTGITELDDAELKFSSALETVQNDKNNVTDFRTLKYVHDTLNDAKILAIFDSALKTFQNTNNISIQDYVNVLNTSLGLLHENDTLVVDSNVNQGKIVAKAKAVIIYSEEAELFISNSDSQAKEKVQINLEMNIVLSIISIAILEVIIYFGWMAFKRRYLLRMMEMKPEVKVDES